MPSGLQKQSNFGCGPGLLISVRSPEEFEDALSGHPAVLDIKEPARGALGIAAPSIWQDVVAAAERISHAGTPPKLSAALGEVVDWSETRAIPQVPAGLSYVKLGLSQLVGRVDWVDRWLKVRQGFERMAESPLRHVAVAYADWEIAAAPHPREVIAAAAQTECVGVLIDTFSKRRGGVLQQVSVNELEAWLRMIRSENRFSVLAGSLRSADLSVARTLPADLVGVRGGVCQQHSRESRIDRRKVEAFAAELQDVNFASELQRAPVWESSLKT